ncbi:MAG: peptidylprolyl isomerase, partial [Planctomycetales bacterium]|nr:peptidylprolyl isomerase [Planctomycetales bacterium]
ADGGPTSPFDSQRILFRVQAAATPVPTIALAAASDSGISETDQLTNAADLQLLVSNLVVGSTVQVILQGDIVDTFVATSETMEVSTADISDLQDGSYLIIAWQALDGIPSDLSTPLEVIIDRTAPTALTDVVPTSVTTGELLEIDLTHPEESDSFRYFLGNPPVGMSIELQTGLIRWRPNSTQLGPHTFQVRTADAAGNETSQDYTIHVVQPDFLADYDLISIATQLAESGAVLWGTPWDTATLAQRELFQDAARFLPLQNAMDGHRRWTTDAQAAEITRLPTWIFANGSRLEGEQSIRDIATAAGITLTESNEPWFAEINDIALSSGSPRHIAIDAFDPNSDALRFEVRVDNPDVSASVLAGNRSLQLNLAGYGSMTFQLFEQRVPLITAQIASLVEAGHYDGLEIFKINSQLIQTGDVRDLGMGHSDVGPVDDQFHPDLQHNQPGVLSMAKLIDDANDAQFFITNTPQRHYDFHNSIFGQLTDGDDIRQSVVAATTHVGGFSQYGMEITSAHIMNDQENGLLMLSAPEDYQGTATVTVTAFDSDGNSFSRSFAVQIQPDEYNSGPYLIDTPESITVPQSGGALTLNSFDVEGDAVRYSARTTSNVAMDVTVDAVSGRIEVHPPAGFVGTVMLEVAVHPVGISDTADRYDRQQILVNVTEETIANDLNLDGRVDYLDIAAACHEINRGNTEFDLNNDGRLDRYDIAEFTEIAFQTGPGDADLNGTFATTDLINMMKAGEYEDSLNGNSTWLTGDFNCDGEFDSTDLIFAFQLGQFVEEA